MNAVEGLGARRGGGVGGVSLRGMSANDNSLIVGGANTEKKKRKITSKN